MTKLFVPQVAVVDFNHHRGPEVEFWLSSEGQALQEVNQWSQLAFQALPDGAHAATEEFSYFTLAAQNADSTDWKAVGSTTLFGVSCTRQIRADRLRHKSAQVTRSFVQKAIVVVVDKPIILGRVREKLAVVTAAWFAQQDFSNIDILKEYQASLERDLRVSADIKDGNFGLSLRELLYDLRHQTLVLLKCLLLQRRVLFFSTRCERLCMTQFALVSLIPGLLEHLQDAAAPELHAHTEAILPSTNFRPNDRDSMLAYMGLPLQIFGKNSFFSPYTPLQSLDLLSSPISQSYVAGSTNVLFLGQKDLPEAATNPNRNADVVVNLDESSLSSKITVLEPELYTALSLSAADRRWVDVLTQSVLDTWNPADPSRPTTHSYTGSEDAIRLAFEEYILSLLSSVAYGNHFDQQPNPYLNTGTVHDERYPDPLETSHDFNNDFLQLWKQTQNYKLWYSLTADNSIFNIVEPRHPTAGGLNLEDVQRRLGIAMQGLQVDEKLRQGREQAAKAIEASTERVRAGAARFWKEVDALKQRRDGSRVRATVVTEQIKDNQKPGTIVNDTHRGNGTTVTDLEVPTTDASSKPATALASAASSTIASFRDRAAKVNLQRSSVDTAQIQASARDNAAKAGAYLSSWGSWASQKSRDWQSSRVRAPEAAKPVSPEPSKSSVETARVAMLERRDQVVQQEEARKVPERKTAAAVTAATKAVSRANIR